MSRFVRKLGFDDFKEFKLELARETSGAVENLFEAVTPQDSDAEIARKVFLGDIKSLEDTLKMLSFADLSAAAKAICGCRRLVLFGIGGLGVRGATMPRCASPTWTSRRRPTWTPPRSSSRPCASAAATWRSASPTRAGPPSRWRARAWRGKRARWPIGISNYPRSPLRDACGIFFCTSFPENRVKVAAISSRVAQLCILDALYLLVARHKERLWDVERANALTERMLRIKTTAIGGPETPRLRLTLRNGTRRDEWIAITFPRFSPTRWTAWTSRTTSSPPTT